MRVGDDYGDGLKVSQDKLLQALEAVNSFVHECKDLHD